MKKTALILGIVVLLSVTNGHAAEREDVYERSGVVSGALAGAAIGGAPGAILGAGIGGLFGNKIERGLDADELDVQIADLNAESVRLEKQLHGLLIERERLAQEARELRQMQAQSIDTLEFDLFFKTGTAELESLAQKRISEFARHVSGNQTLTVQIDGYADQRGADQYNDTLSESRAAAVRDALINSGISPEKIVIQGHGSRESLAPDGDIDAYALERRATVTVQGGPALDADSGQVADTGVNHN